MKSTDITKGLTSAEVEERKARGECNTAPATSTRTVGQIVRGNLFTLFNLINIVLAALIAATGSYRNMLFMGVVVCNLAIGIFQELRSKREIDRLSLISAPRAHLLRDGRERELPTGEIVLGDIMLLSAGRQVCADGVVVQGELEVDESLLTGESDPVRKAQGDSLLSGSFVVSGAAKAQATAVGADAYAGKISAGAKTAARKPSEMMESINRIIRVVSVCIVPFSAVLFLKAIYVAGQELDSAIISTSAALIGMIPEGLVLLTSLALAVSSIRLARHNTLCQDLYCVEALARVDTLCLDKTGTITTGNMQVAEVVPLEGGFDYREALTALADGCDDVNATMAAIKREFGGKSALRCVGRIPFTSAKKWSAAMFEGYGTLVLGAAEFILPERELGSVAPLTADYSARGYRVLLLARTAGESAPSEGYSPKDSRPSPKALVILSDEVRLTAPQTLEYFKRQGVDVKVISGDAPATAAAVAKRAGLEGADRCIDASQLTDGELAAAAESHTVFGRVTPYQKQALIRALKSAGHKVAMTGDGVNDVLALREADCSVAMQSGSDAARCVSQLVLLDSDFANMPLAVEEGRRVINNIQRSAALFLVKTVFSFLLAVLFLFLPAAYPFQPIQMTLISGLAIGIPSFLLALEPNHSRVKGSFISNVMRRAAPGGAAVTLGVVAVLAAQWLLDIPQECASTMAVLVTAAVMFAVLFGVCRPFNRRRAAMLAALIGLFILACALLPQLFCLAPLTAPQAAVTAGIAAVAAAMMLWWSRTRSDLVRS